ncbi:MAG: hypothetical protein LDL33_15800 [Desulfomonile sp.]|nr:hypothetical protein [Desulfomonile sp.]
MIPLSEHPDMDRLAEILRELPADRQEAFLEWNDREVTQDRGSAPTLTMITQDRGGVTNGDEAD